MTYRDGISVNWGWEDETSSWYETGKLQEPADMVDLAPSPAADENEGQ
jgi:hypothetical protein